MTLHYEDGGLRLFHGKNMDILGADALGYPFALGYHPDRLIPDASYESIVTDPPYELGFMGKGWDSTGIAYDVEMWRECWRVLKPGGYLLAFGGTRTWHRIATAIEDAGFEIRDSIAWLYGQGFPKSMDVSKAIDKAGGVSPATQAAVLVAARERAGLTRETVAETVGCTPSSVADWERGRARAAGAPVEFVTPSAEYRDKLANLLGYTADERRIVGATVDRRDDGTVVGLGHSGAVYGSAETEAAKEWEGWGTALKPAFEPIIVARKPLVGTVAANVLAYGTGALNIDASRVGWGTEGDKSSARKAKGYSDAAKKAVGKVAASENASGFAGEVVGTDLSSGRFPANVLLDESQAASLDEQSGILTSGLMKARTERAPRPGGKIYGADNRNITAAGDTYADTGGASRFFPTFRYEAKAPGAERPEVDGVAHATVKPLSLMRWLVRLVTRPGGRVLDLYAGSGTTGEAALLEGMEVDLIELEEVHLPLILQRVRKPLQPSMFGDWNGDAA